MTMRKTPYARICYPWASDVANAVDLQSMAADIDQALVQTNSLASSFSRMSSAVATRKNTVQSVAKGTFVTISHDTIVADNGTDSPLANGAWWNSATPTRLTAPAPCVVLATGMCGLNITTAFGAAGSIQVFIALNGATGSNGVQGNKYQPLSTATGQQYTSTLSMWKLNAGDYLELKIIWTSSNGAGPYNTDINVPPTLAVMPVALPAVP